MGLRNTKDNYSAVSRFFHWATAFLILGLLVLGFYMIGLEPAPDKFKLYGLHKSFGTLVLMLAVARLLWRVSQQQPEKMASHQAWERGLAHLVHIVLYLSMFLMPLSGWLMSSAGNFSYSFFGLFDMPNFTGKSEALYKLMRVVHEYTAIALIAIIGAHILGAVKHAVIDKDATLKRMVPEKGYVGISFLVVVIAGAALLSASGLFVLDKLGKKEKMEARQVKVVAAVPPIMVSSSPNKDEDAESAVQSWQLIPAESTINFSVKVSGDEFSGTFSIKKAEIYFDPNKPMQSHAYIAIDTASAQTGSDERDGYIAMEPWLFSESFPESTYKISHFEHKNGLYVAHGVFSLRGVSQDLAVPLAINIEDVAAQGGMEKRAIAQGGFVLNRLEYGVGQGSWEDPSVAEHQVKVSVKLTAKAEN